MTPETSKKHLEDMTERVTVMKNELLELHERVASLNEELRKLQVRNEQDNRIDILEKRVDHLVQHFKTVNRSRLYS